MNFSNIDKEEVLLGSREIAVVGLMLFTAGFLGCDGPTFTGPDAAPDGGEEPAEDPNLDDDEKDDDKKETGTTQTEDSEESTAGSDEGESSSSRNDGEMHSDSDSDSDSDNDADTDADSDTDTDGDGDGDSDGDGDGDTDADSDTGSDADTSTTDSDDNPACSGCEIDGECIDNNTVNDDNECEICNVEENRNGWSNNDISCNDGQYCTVNDSCRDMVCTGDERDCDDQLSCTEGESCDEVTDSCVPGTSICDEGDICDQSSNSCQSTCAGCLLDGERCIPEGESTTGNDCMVCDPDRSDTALTPATGADCDDGDLCTYDDKCDSSGQCGGTARTCVNDPTTCGARRACNGTSTCAISYPSSATSCDDGDYCTVDGHCDQAGHCVESTRDCSDAYSCTNDSCYGGSCHHVIQSNYCVIGNQCLTNGSVNGGNICEYCNPSEDQEDWSPRPNTVTCSNGQFCDGVEHCDGFGTCTSPGNPCANVTGPCANTACNETNDNCYANSNTPCNLNVTEESCSATSSCGADARRRSGTQYCSGTSTSCNGYIVFDSGGTWETKDDCNASEQCVMSGGVASCQYASSCGVYCDSEYGRCWTRTSSASTYDQVGADSYCTNLTFANESNWHLPYVAEFNTLVEGPHNGCYWPTQMGTDCDKELWTADNSQSFAFWVGSSAMRISSELLYVLCVASE